MRRGEPHAGIRPIAMPGIHERFVPFFLRLLGDRPPRAVDVLDAGTGHGALAARLHGLGFRVRACDFAPERFHAHGVEFQQADLTERLPYQDASFDFVLAVEVVEHVPDHATFFRECARVLRPGGRLVLSTPNIVSLKSRLRFALTGFFYSFKPLGGTDDGLEHVASLTPDQLRDRGRRAGLTLETVACDKYQRTSLALVWLAPLLRLAGRLAHIGSGGHNTRDLLLGRILFVVFRKPGG